MFFVQSVFAAVQAARAAGGADPGRGGRPWGRRRPGQPAGPCKHHDRSNNDIADNDSRNHSNDDKENDKIIIIIIIILMMIIRL